MTNPYPPGYRDPEFPEGSFPADFIENIPDCEHDDDDNCEFDEENE